MATRLTNLARDYLRTGHHDRPGALLDRALAIQEKMLGRDHPDVALTLSSRAELEAQVGGTVEAFRAVSFRGTRSGCPDFQSLRFDPLPASLQEVDEVVALWNQARVCDDDPCRVLICDRDASRASSCARGTSWTPTSR